MLAADNWCVKVHDKIYGPYTSAQLSAFVDEGRITRASLVSAAGGNVWKPLGEHTGFAHFFKEDAASNVAKFGRKSPASPDNQETETANFVIIFDITSGAASQLEPVIRKMGPAARLADNTWFVSSSGTLTGIKNTIVPHLNVRQPVFIVDTTRGKVDWQNFTPEIHSKLVKTWSSRFGPSSARSYKRAQPLDAAG